jgi:hypothetical protein
MTTNAPIYVNPDKYHIQRSSLPAMDDLFSLMQHDGRFEYASISDRATFENGKKEDLLETFKKASLGFYAHPDQFIPIHAPNDVLFGFFYLAAGHLRAEGDSTFNSHILRASRPLSALEDLQIQEIANGVVTEKPLSEKAIPAETNGALFLFNRRSYDRIPLDPITSSLLRVSDGTRTVDEILDRIRQPGERGERMELEMLWRFGYLYRSRFLKLVE